MSAPTNLIFVLCFTCCVSRVGAFLLNDTHKISDASNHQVDLFSEVLHQHSLIKVAKCSFADDESYHIQIICERLARVKTDKWQGSLLIDNIFLRTQFTFEFLEEDDTTAKRFDFRSDVKMDMESTVDTEYDYDNVSGTGQALVDEIYVADISKVEKHNECEHSVRTVGTHNNTKNNETLNNTSYKFVKLTKLKLQKVEEPYPWDNATINQIKKDYIFFLFVASEKFVWDMEFNSSKPVGILDFEKGCFLRTR